MNNYTGHNKMLVFVCGLVVNLVERMCYNDQVMPYNTRIKKMPAAIIANMFGFNEKPYFEAEKGAETVPKVEF